MKEYSVSTVVEVDISNEDLAKMLRERFRELLGADYKVQDGKLLRWQRSNWTDYDYLEVDLPKEVYAHIMESTIDCQKVIKNIHKVFGLNIQGKSK